MFTRIVQGTFNLDMVDEARETVEDEVLNTLRHQTGFVDLISSLDPNNGRFVTLTLWRTREDADRYARNEAPRILELMQPYFSGQPTIETLQLETSTIHNVARGEAAA
jgi:hypothetical protein